MKKLTRKSLDEMSKGMQKISELEQRLFVGGSTVSISVNRSFYGTSSTMSYFEATAYDDSGNVIDSMSGMFLEPEADYDRCTSAGSDTAIQYGTYSVVPSTFHGQSGYYEVSGVDGRSGILIHAGNSGGDTSGCFLPGTSGHQSGSNYTVSQSGDKLRELNDFLSRYGGGGITMNVSI